MGLFSSIGGLFGGNDAAKDLEKDLARIAEQNRFQPFNINSPLANGSFDGQTGTASLNPNTAKTFDQFNQLINRTGNKAKGFNAQSFQNDFFRSIDRLESQREQEGFDDFESSIFNKRGVSTGTGRQVRDFQESLQQRRFDRQQRAVEASQQFETNLFNQFLGLTGGRSQLSAATLDPLRIGLQAGQLNTQANQIASSYLAQGANARATAKANTGSAIGGLFDAGLGLALGGGGFGGLGGGIGAGGGFTSASGLGLSPDNLFGGGFFE